VNIIPKYATEDTMLLDDPDSWFEGDDEHKSQSAEEMEKEEKRRVFVPAGTQCQIDVVNLRELLNSHSTWSEMRADGETCLIYPLDRHRESFDAS
jgi:hypothetical protein